MIEPYHDLHESVSSIIMKNVETEAEQLLKSIEGTYNPTAFELLEQQAASIGEIFNDTVIETAKKEGEKLQKLFDSTLNSFGLMKDVSLNTLINSSILGISEIKSSQLQEVLDLESIAGVHGLEEMLKLATSNAFDIASSYFAEYADNSHTSEETLNEFEELINKPKTNLTSENYIFFYISTILSLLMFVYSIHSSKQSDKERQASINALETTVISQFMILNSNTVEINKKLKKQTIDSKPTEYVVERTVNLRTKNSTSKESIIITSLYPNQKVELLKREGKWIYICYFDHIEQVPITGRVYKKYLKMLK
ncbi:SH3 domain-containing protein [Colwellia sp. MSW7]|uniref:SH3 domain-containing protein n=1 Tax=Colwellia maritima TaxID=2912588 RepID=A0ABS9X7B9_9GAMM|nr:SH3 domain-containing protein [Colwellia maritima]MCI2286128.1 SH3 domain-containing protein [Colwellia maritima]